jgi:uncharacterized protein YukE
VSLEPFNLAPLVDAQNRFRSEFTEFARLWQETKQDWRDDRARRFEQEHLSDLGPSLTRFATALSELTETLRKAQAAVADTDNRDRELY